MADTLFDLSITAASNTAFKTVGVVGGSLLSTADDAFRNLGAMLAGYDKDLTGIGQTLGGTANAITLTVNQPWASIAQGQLIGFYYTSGPNTAAVTINVTPGGGGAAFGLKAIVNNGGAALVGGEMLDNGFYWLWYNGTSYVLLNGAGSSLSSTDAGASAGPILTLDRNSASPAAADSIGEVDFTGRDSGANSTVYAAIRGAISDPTDTAEIGQLLFRIMSAGTLATKGLWDGSSLVVGDTGSRNTQFGAANLQVKDAAAFARYNATAATAFQLGIARAQGTPAAPTIVANGDTLGYLQWEGYDGANFIRAASITVDVDGVPGLTDMPGKMSFKTTSDGGSTPGTRMSLNAVGFLNVSSGSLGRAAPVTKTTSFTVADAENFIISNRGATNTATLPDATLFSGRELYIKTITAQTVVSATSNVVPLAGGSAGTAILSATAGKWALLVSNGTTWDIMAGN